MQCKHTAEKRPDWIRHDQNEKKKFTSEALVIALKEKTEDFFTTFPVFFQVWKISGQNYKTFLRIQDSVRTL